MKIALFGKQFNEGHRRYLAQIIDLLEARNCSIYWHEKFYSSIFNQEMHAKQPCFSSHEDLPEDLDFIFSIGGDGTLLDTVPLVRDSGIPILGINLGRMGFLSSVSPSEIQIALEQLSQKKYTIDSRTLIHLDQPSYLFPEIRFALNELTVFRKDSTSLVSVKVYVDGVFLNTYWSDGLIIATPTGSTAYSLSSGGPIIVPEASNLLITPIATHNLTVRPVVIPDSSEVRIVVTGRDKQYYVSMDSRLEQIHEGTELIIRKEDFNIHLVRLENAGFYSAIRNKLSWGRDIRN